MHTCCVCVFVFSFLVLRCRCKLTGILPSVSFDSDPQLARQQAAKMKCILSYFDRLFELGGDIKGTITFKRQVSLCGVHYCHMWPTLDHMMCSACHMWPTLDHMMCSACHMLLELFTCLGVLSHT